MPTAYHNNKGFTMVEIVAVLIIVSILGAVTASRMLDTSAESASAREVVKAHIRYAQVLAMKSNTICGIDFKDNYYVIFKNNDITDNISLPGIDSTNFPISPSVGTATETIYFDLWGTPYTDLALNTQRPTGVIDELGITLTEDTGHVQ